MTTASSTSTTTQKNTKQLHDKHKASQAAYRQRKCFFFFFLEFLSLDSELLENVESGKYRDKYGYEAYLKYYCPLSNKFGYNLAGVPLPVPPANELMEHTKKLKRALGRSVMLFGKQLNTGWERVTPKNYAEWLAMETDGIVNMGHLVSWLIEHHAAASRAFIY
ncbi:hypothetical protein C8J57DRAFT_1247933 [Mycena rebaudengoi]|nr:hypothetical protein C8J57DRAFT_1247933 [Mycena rebaudengoi]